MTNRRLMKQRADRILTDRGLAESRQKAQALIMAGQVYMREEKIRKPGQLIPVDQIITVRERMPYVSRGGLKLADAVAKSGVETTGAVAADLGVSTGGFTDFLLQSGVKKVFAVDVDTRQIDIKLRSDPRVVLIRKNARYLEPGDFSEPLDLVTMDVSFISVLKILPAIAGFLSGGTLLSLIKPQFEVGRREVGKKGIVRDHALHEGVLRTIILEASKMGFGVRGVIRPSVRGQKGNQEYFLYWKLGRPELTDEQVSERIKEAVWNEEN